MIVRYGRSAPDGFLPVFSVGTEAEAKALLALACPRNHKGEYVAQELAEQQSLENLAAFGERLKAYHDKYFVARGRCECDCHTR